MLDNTHVARNFRPGDVYIYIYMYMSNHTPVYKHTYIYIRIYTHSCMYAYVRGICVYQEDRRQTDRHADSDVEGIHEDG